MATEYCLVCAAHGRKVAAVRIDYPQGDRVDYKCPVCPYATTLVSEADVNAVLSMRSQIDDDLVQEEILRREIAEKVTSDRERKNLEDQLRKLLFDDMSVLPDNRIKDLTEFNLRWLTRNLGVNNSDHKNYPEAMELIKRLLRPQQKMRSQIDDDLVQEEILQREVVEKVASGVKIKKLKQRLGELLRSMTIPVKKRNPFDLADLTRLVRTLGRIENMEHENYPEVMELVNELLRLQQKELDNV